MNPEECYNFLRSEIRSFPFLSHACNILTKKDHSEKLSVLDQIVPKYVGYYLRNKNLLGIERETVKQRVDALNTYYDYLYSNGFDNIYSAQSKFRPTILEEFMSILFRDLLQEIKKNISGSAEIIDCGSIKAYTNLFFFARNFKSFIETPCMGVNQKDQDFAIFRKTHLNIDNTKEIHINLPVVAIENKTFIDKTMLEGAIATAEKIKTGNPYCLFCIVTECYDVSMDVDPAYSRLDQIFVLRKCTRRASRQPIDADVVFDLVSMVQDHLKRPWSDIQVKLSTAGKLI